jgi:hypothetical protein
MLIASMATLASVYSFISGFSIAYFELAHDSPSAFHIDGHMTLPAAFYFTIVTFSTTGFGDIYPTSDMARALVAAEIVGALLYTLLVFSIIGSAIINAPSLGRATRYDGRVRGQLRSRGDRLN